MTAQSPPWAIQADAHPASAVRRANAALFAAPTTSFSGGVQAVDAGGAHGVVRPNDLKVTQHGTPNMSVDIAAGMCNIRGTEATLQGVYAGCTNSASLTLTISAADATNARKDLVVAKVRDSEYSGSSDDFSIVVVTGTPAGSPSDPAIPENSLVLARVAVAANATSIVTANITDLRTNACAAGGVLVCTSSTRPTSQAALEGQMIYETDTNKMYVSDGSNWVPPKNVAGGALGAPVTFTSDKTTTPSGSSGTITLASSGSITIPANRRVRITGWCRDVYQSSATAGSFRLAIKESSTVLAESLLNGYGTANVPLAGGTKVEALVTPSAGAHTYTFTLDGVFVPAGTATAEAASTYPGFILVEDIGGV